jgi:hypothetical protein
MTTENSNTRKKPVTHKDLAILAMMQGVDALDAKLAGHTNPVAVLDKVIETFKANGKDTADLDAKRELFANARGNGVKGRKAPKVGEVRTYSVQQIGEDGDRFIRLPLECLEGVQKGGKVAVTFGADAISVALIATSTDESAEGEDLSDDSDSEDLDDDQDDADLQAAQ